jgi:hypothetical protein
MIGCECNAVASYLSFGTLQFSGSLRVNDPFLGALCPSKSGLMNKHIVCMKKEAPGPWTTALVEGAPSPH